MLNVPGSECCAFPHASPLPHVLSGSDPIRSVLYVDDDWEHLSARCALLQDAGYRVEATDSPAAGLSSYIQNAFDAVILDFHLPFVSSGLLANVMRRFRRDIPLILVSDRIEFAEYELGILDRQLPRGTSEGAFLDNMNEVIVRCHERPANQPLDLLDYFDREDQI